MGALLLFSPTVHFWYLSWIIPFIALRPTASWVLLCLTIGGYFVTNGIAHYTGKWLLPPWAFAAQWIPFALLFCRDLQLGIHRFRFPLDEQPPIPSGRTTTNSFRSGSHPE